MHIDVFVGFFYFFFVLRIAGYLRSTIFRFMSVFEPTGTPLTGSGDIVVRGLSFVCTGDLEESTAEIPESKGKGSKIAPKRCSISSKTGPLSPKDAEKELRGLTLESYLMHSIVSAGLSIDPSTVKGRDRIARALKKVSPFVKFGRVAFNTLEMDLESANVRPSAFPGQIVEMFVEDPTALLSGISGIAVKAELRQNSWKRTERAIGSGLARPELFGSSTLSAAGCFPLKTCVLHSSLLDQKLGAKLCTVFPRLASVAYEFFADAKEFEYELMVALTNKEEGRSLKAHYLDGAIFTGLGVQEKSVAGKAKRVSRTGEVLILQCGITDLDLDMREAIESAMQVALPKLTSKGAGQKGSSKGKAAADPEVQNYEDYVTSLSSCITEEELVFEVGEKTMEGLITEVLSGSSITSEAAQLLAGLMIKHLEYHDDSSVVDFESEVIDVSLTDEQIKSEFRVATGSCLVSEFKEGSFGMSFRPIDHKAFEELKEDVEGGDGASVQTRVKAIDSGLLTSPSSVIFSGERVWSPTDKSFLNQAAEEVNKTICNMSNDFPSQAVAESMRNDLIVKGKFQEIEEMTFSDVTKLCKLAADFEDRVFAKEEHFWKVEVAETDGIANNLLKEVAGRTAEINVGKKIWSTTKGLHDHRRRWMGPPLVVLA